MTTTVDLLAALGTHLAEFELPAIASVNLAAAMSAPQVTVQLSCDAPSVIAQGLLAWADTLTEITAQAWRVPRGEWVHLSVTGLLPGGAAIQIYGALPVTHRGPGADLAPGATTTLPLGTPGQVTEGITL
jgi:FtsP/CotA-like multicopper oxidase with cupredoxin domain